MQEELRRPGAGLRILIAVAAALFVSLALAACGGDDDNDDSSAGGGGGDDSALISEATKVSDQSQESLMYSKVNFPTKPSEVEPYGEWRGPDSAPKHEAGKNVQVIVCSKASPACLDAGNGAVAAGKELGWTVEIIDGAGTPQGFAQAFNTAFQRGADAIITVAVPTAAVADSLADAKQRGVLTVATGDAEPKSGTKYDAYVPFPMPAMSAVVGWAVIADSEGEANVIVVNDPGFPVLTESAEALEGVLSECSGCSSSKVEWQITDAADPTKATKIIQGALSSNPDANYLYVPYSIPQAAVIQAVQAAGKGDQVKIVTKDGDPPQFEALADGSIALTVGSSVVWAGWASIDQVIRGFAGDPFLGPTETGLGIAQFTAENVPPGGSIENWPEMIDYAAQYRRIWGAEG